MILEFLIDDLILPRICLSSLPPISPLPFPCTIVLVPTSSLQTGESFFGRPARPPFRQSALDPDILISPLTPHGLCSVVLYPPPLPWSNAITASDPCIAWIPGQVAVHKVYDGCKPQDQQEIYNHNDVEILNLYMVTLLLAVHKHCKLDLILVIHHCLFLFPII